MLLIILKVATKIIKAATKMKEGEPWCSGKVVPW